MFIFTLLLTCLLSSVQCTPVYSGDGSVDDEANIDALLTSSDLDEKFQSKQWLGSDLDDKVISSDELIATEFVEEQPLLMSSAPPHLPNNITLSNNNNNQTDTTRHNNQTDPVVAEPPLLLPSYEDETDQEDMNNVNSPDYTDDDYVHDDMHRVLQLRHRYNDAVPAPLQNLPHDIPPDRTIAEVLAENTIKDIQYDEQRIKDLVNELLSHTALQEFGEVYSDDADDNEIPKYLNEQTANACCKH